MNELQYIIEELKRVNLGILESYTYYKDNKALNLYSIAGPPDKLVVVISHFVVEHNERKYIPHTFDYHTGKWS